MVEPADPVVAMVAPAAGSTPGASVETTVVALDAVELAVVELVVVFVEESVVELAAVELVVTKLGVVGGLEVVLDEVGGPVSPSRRTSEHE